MSNISRRTFALGGAAAVAGLACASVVPAAVAADQLTGDIWAAPAAIDPASIAQTVEAEVVVIGAGDAGLMASLAAVEEGAKVVTIDKYVHFMPHGVAHACIGTAKQLEEGKVYDAERIIKYFMIQSNNRADQSLLRLWAKYSGKVYDHIFEIAEANDVYAIDMAGFGGGDEDDVFFPEFQCSYMFAGDAPADEVMAYGVGNVAQWPLFKVFEQKILELGGDIRYNTKAEQLVKDPSGRVTGVVAIDADGKYVQFNASKGVVMATGDYGNDPQMVAQFCPWQTLADVNFYQPPINTGDGHKMGVWAGAAMQAGPHCPALHPERIVGPGETPMGASPVLRVNVNGLRYENEQVPAPLVCEGRIRQPQNKAWAIFDGNVIEDSKRMSLGLLRTPSIDESSLEAIEAAGLKADTLEELAQKMGVPVDAFVATVARYTELAAAGVDVDFGKDANNMWEIKTAPFYAVEVPTGTMNTLGGLLINDKMQVLSAESGASEPVPGLYAAGNVAGGFFGSTYPSAVSGINKGWSITGGYLAGKSVVALEA